MGMATNAIFRLCFQADAVHGFGPVCSSSVFIISLSDPSFASSNIVPTVVFFFPQTATACLEKRCKHSRAGVGDVTISRCVP